MLEIDKVEKIINEIAEYYYDWYSKQFILPTMLEIKKELEDIPINHVTVLNFIRSHITEGLKEIGAEA